MNVVKFFLQMFFLTAIVNFWLFIEPICIYM